MNEDKSFSKTFFKIYDKYVTRGDVSFNELKISKVAFTNICMNENFVFDDETIIRICDKCDLKGQELEDMMSFVKSL